MVLSDDQLIEIYARHKAGESCSALARMVQTEWKLCHQVAHMSCRAAVVKLTDHAKGLEIKGVDELEDVTLYKDIERGEKKDEDKGEDTPPIQAPTPPPIFAQYAKDEGVKDEGGPAAGLVPEGAHEPTLPDAPSNFPVSLRSPDERKQAHDAQLSILSLIEIQFGRLNTLLAIERDEKQSLPEITRVVDNIRTLNKDYAALDDQGGTGGIKNKKAATIIEKMVLVLNQVENRSAVAETLTNFPSVLEALAIPVIPDGHATPIAEQPTQPIIDVIPVDVTPPIDTELVNHDEINDPEQSESEPDYTPGPDDPDPLAPW